MTELSKTISNIKYNPTRFYRGNKKKKSIEVIGLDTETLTTGKCFMICTSLGDTFQLHDLPHCLFSRKYRGKNFVAFNLKFDAGSLLQFLPAKSLKLLQKNGEVYFEDYFIKTIANKCLSIRKLKNTIHIYDMMGFYTSSLEKAAQKYLGEGKLEVGSKKFTKKRVAKEWNKIEEYCIKDAVLVKRLADRIIRKFEDFGVYPKKLYSVAYISYQYFTTHCGYINVKRFWDKHRILLDYAMQSFNGGKFEVTTKGSGKLYEYDIVSAYPYEIANLVDITDARIDYNNEYMEKAIYGFLKCEIEIPYGVSSPVALKDKDLNYFPIGKFVKVITKTEYEYLVKYGCTINIIDAIWLSKKYIIKPYEKEIYNLMKMKDLYKKEGRKLDYHTIKIFLNSFYGKMVQLIKMDGFYKAGSSWHPIFASVITANVRCRISEMQQLYKNVIAVHTDSIISTKPLDFPDSGGLGDMVYELEGEGVIIGSGIYQIGDKSRFRGFDSREKLLDLLPEKGNKLNIEINRPYSWREVAHRNMDVDMINRFCDMPRNMRLNFDRKRIWLDDYKCFSELKERNVESVPWSVNFSLTP